MYFDTVSILNSPIRCIQHLLVNTEYMGARYHTIAFSQLIYRWEGHIDFELLLATSLASPGNFAPIALHCNYLMVLVVKENAAMIMMGKYSELLFSISDN